MLEPNSFRAAAAEHKGKQPPPYAGEVVGNASRRGSSRRSSASGRRNSFSGPRPGGLETILSGVPADITPATDGAARPATLPPKSPSFGSRKERKRDAEQQYESVVVRTATGDRLVVRRPVAGPSAGAGGGGLPPRSGSFSSLGGSGSGSRRMRKAVEHSQAEADAAAAAAAAHPDNQLPPPSPLRRPPSGKAASGGGSLFKKMVSRGKVHKEATDTP